MSLCICFNHFNTGQFEIGLAISDSRLTTLRKSKSDKAFNDFTKIPSDKEISNINDFGIKIQKIHFVDSQKQRDIVVCIAGAVSLGLQSIIHLESALMGVYGEISFDRLLEIIENTIRKFWQNASDKAIEYLFMLADDNQCIRIFKKSGDITLDSLVEIESNYEIRVGVIGDNSDGVLKTIFCEINKIIICNDKIPFATATEIACVRALRREIENEQNKLVGGYIQAAKLKGQSAEYLAVHYKNSFCFRGVAYGDKIMPDEYPLKYESWSFGPDVYDPNLDIEQIVQQIRI